uniref:3-hydroxyisobutyrate dehydrogenase n=1 Tax=Romanomermis culicivorax TaxID=13658 RepID=A0A915K3L3_ROMCU
MIGFIGLGNMGKHMAQNLAKAGQKLVIYDRLPAVMDAIKGEHVKKANSAAEVAEASDYVVTMIPTGKHVLEVFNGPKGILEGAKPKTLCMDSSTIEPSVAKEVYKSCKAKKVNFLDTPVSGGVGGAENATLTFMVGGDKADFDRSVPVLKCMGKNIFHCGAVGNGQAAKICNNMLLAITMIGTSETLNLGRKLGLDLKLLTDIINTSSGRNWSCDTYNPAPNIKPGCIASKNYEGGFQTTLMTKDLGLAQSVATSTMSPIPLGSLCHQIYRIMLAKPEYQTKDFAAVYKF